MPKLSLALAGYEATQPGLCDDVLAYLSRAETLYGGGLEVRYDLTLVGEPGAYQSEVYRFGGGPIIVALSMPNRHPVEYDSVHSLPATAFHEMKHVTWALGGVTSGASEGETALEELSVQLLTHCANGAHGGRIAFAFDPAADQARVRRDLADLVRNKQPNAETFDLLYREGAAFLLREAGVPSQGGADWLARTCRTVTADPYALRGVIGDLLGRNV